MNSVSGGFGLVNFCPEFGWAAFAFEHIPGLPFAKPAGPKAECINSVSGGLWAPKLLSGIWLGGYRMLFAPWPALSETGWAQSRMYKFCVGRLWAHKLLPGIRLGGFRL